MAMRHVETLRTLGFNAVIRLSGNEPTPTWIQSVVPIERSEALLPEDIIVLPEDGLSQLTKYASCSQRKIIFCQNHFSAASQGVGLLPRELKQRYGEYIACSRTVAKWLRRFVPQAEVEIIHAFADERTFFPRPKTLSVACSPSKRVLEFKAIQTMTNGLVKTDRPWKWSVIINKSESEVAEIMRNSSIFISLNRLEGLGLTTLEAMASGCFVLGFTGLGGREYASNENGYWVDDDDCEACADALIKALRQFDTSDTIIGRIIDNSLVTARKYSYQNFIVAMKLYWERRLPRSLYNL